ncbi:MAG: hypothetical protein O3A13_03350 [Proteobacteria bacterium]|nr:hypothetical protein [Pseudomonadota bacterium]MDA0992651.1 hypothetical protein [Pseudomonadota bacterium]
MGDYRERAIATGTGLVIRHAPATIHEVAAWPGANSALEHFLNAYGSGARNPLLRVGPGRVWVVGADTLELQTATNGMALIDLSHALVRIQVSGESARLVLRKGLPVDLHPSVFPDGSIATSAIERIVVTVHNNGDSFDLFCRRSYSGSLEHWLADASIFLL